MISSNDLKPGLTIQQDNNIFVVLESSQNKQARSGMIVKAKVKNLRTRAIVELSFAGGDKIENAHIDKKEMQYLYDDGDSLIFMDTETYEQLEINKDRLTWELNFLKPNDNVTVSMFESEVLGLILPDKVSMQIVECEPAVKGDTATSASKLAKVESGLEIRVPLFIEQDEVILVNTSDGKYSGRA